MNCVKCGKSFQDDALFCPYCGKKQNDTPKKRDRRANGTGSVYYDSRSKMWIAQKVTGKHCTADRKVRFTYKRKSFKRRTDALKEINAMSDIVIRPDFTLSYYYQAFQKGKYSSLSNSKQYAYQKAYTRLKTLHNVPMKDLTINSLQAILQGVSTFYTAKCVPC